MRFYIVAPLRTALERATNEKANCTIPKTTESVVDVFVEVAVQAAVVLCRQDPSGTTAVSHLRVRHDLYF